MLVFLAACAACVRPQATQTLAVQPQEPLRIVYLASHGWHAGIIIRRADIPPRVWPEQAHFPDADFLEVGWGDRLFYQTPNPHLGITLRAAFWPTDSVLHVVGFSGPVTAYFPHSEIIEIRLRAPGLERLCRYIAASYDRNAFGDSIYLGPGLYGTSHFYRSRESYHLFKNCNVWTAKALQSAGCPIRPATILTVASLMSNARACGHVVSSEVVKKPSRAAREPGGRSAATRRIR